MDNHLITRRIQCQLESLLLETILMVLEKITIKIAAMKEEDKF